MEVVSVVFEKINFFGEKMRFVKELLIGGENLHAPFLYKTSFFFKKKRFFFKDIEREFKIL